MSKRTYDMLVRLCALAKALVKHVCNLCTRPLHPLVAASFVLLAELYVCGVLQFLPHARLVANLSVVSFVVFYVYQLRRGLYPRDEADGNALLKLVGLYLLALQNISNLGERSNYFLSRHAQLDGFEMLVSITTLVFLGFVVCAQVKRVRGICVLAAGASIGAMFLLPDSYHGLYALLMSCITLIVALYLIARLKIRTAYVLTAIPMLIFVNAYFMAPLFTPIVSVERVTTEQVCIYVLSVGAMGYAYLASLVTRRKDTESEAIAALDLSARELEIARLILAGKSFRDIATDLALSLGTISTYAKRIYTKAEVSSKDDFLARYGSTTAVAKESGSKPLTTTQIVIVAMLCIVALYIQVQTVFGWIGASGFLRGGELMQAVQRGVAPASIVLIWYVFSYKQPKPQEILQFLAVILGLFASGLTYMHNPAPHALIHVIPLIVVIGSVCSNYLLYCGLQRISDSQGDILSIGYIPNIRSAALLFVSGALVGYVEIEQTELLAFALSVVSLVILLCIGFAYAFKLYAPKEIAVCLVTIATPIAATCIFAMLQTYQFAWTTKLAGIYVDVLQCLPFVCALVLAILVRGMCAPKAMAALIIPFAVGRLTTELIPITLYNIALPPVVVTLVLVAALYMNIKQLDTRLELARTMTDVAGPLDQWFLQSGIRPAELEVIRLLAKGMSAKECAKALFISEATVATHRQSTYKTLHIHSLLELQHLIERVTKELSS